MTTFNVANNQAKFTCGVITLFPEMFTSCTQGGVVGRAVANGAIAVQFYNPRDFTLQKHKQVDDKPYGGGPGMVLQYEPLKAALTQAQQDLIGGANAGNGADGGSAGRRSMVVYMSPQGKRITSSHLQEFVASGRIPIFVAGRYEGVDQRFIDNCVDEEWSIGDYVLSGGELPIMVALDALARFVPGTVGCGASVLEDSFVDGLLDYPHYTRPHVVDGMMVPEVLLNGDHAAVAKWRLKQKLGRTWQLRQDLWQERMRSRQPVAAKQDLAEQDLLAEFIKETGLIKETGEYGE
jgi:tRNA (guanine37-N1)-methyltransferase